MVFLFNYEINIDLVGGVKTFKKEENPLVIYFLSDNYMFTFFNRNSINRDKNVFNAAFDLIRCWFMNLIMI